MSCPLTTSRDELFEQYNCLFSPSHNRNAASHVWVNHLLHHSQQMTSEQFVEQARAFCAVSGSTISSTNEFVQDIATIAGDTSRVSMNHCCWPCACDIKDASDQGRLHLMATSVSTADGMVDANYILIDDPCVNPSKIPTEAPAVTCLGDRLENATHIDTERGRKVVIGFAFDSDRPSDDLYDPCASRASNGYKNGMGMIFRDVLDLS